MGERRAIFRFLGLLILASLLAIACRAAPEEEALGEPYKVGLTADITGPQAAYFGAQAEAFRIYMAKLNDEGGINGHPVQLIIEDNRSDPSRAAAQAKKLLDTDKVLLLVNITASHTHAPVIAEAKKAGAPVLLASTSCIKEAYAPPVNPLVFCDFNSPFHDMENVVRYIRSAGKDPIRIGLLAAETPLSRAAADYVEARAKELGMQVVAKEVYPMATTDFTPYASKMIDAGVEWMVNYIIPPHALAMFEALVKLGWKGKMVHNVSERDLNRLRNENFYAYTYGPPFAEGLPVHQEIKEAAAKYGSPYRPEEADMQWGWSSGVVVAEALKRCGWPCTRDKLRDVMEGLQVDLKSKGLRGGAGPLKWTAQDHLGPVSYAIYHWDSAKGRLVRVSDWVTIEARDLKLR